jgi:hypothetical protein
MAQELIGFKIQVDGQEKVVKTLGDMKQLIKEANFELLAAQKNFGDYSQEAVKAAKKVADLKDSLAEARETADLFDPGKKFQAFSGALTAVAGGISAVQGAFGLLGAEGKDIEKTLVKVQSALALSQGLSTIKDSAKDFARLKTVAVDSFKAIKTAIGSVGIGALVIAIGALVAYWDDIKALVTGVSKEQEKLLKDSQSNLKAEQEKLTALGGQDNVLKLQGKSEKDILKLKIAQTDQVIKATEENIKQQQIVIKAQIEAEKRNKAILKGILEFVTAPLQLLIDGVAKVADLFGAGFEFNIAESVAGAVFDPKEIEDKGAEAIKELDKQLGELKNQRAGFQLAIQGIDKKASDDAAAKRKKEIEDEKAKLEKLLELREKFEQDVQAQLKKSVEDNIKFITDRENQFNKFKEQSTTALEKRIGANTTNFVNSQIEDNKKKQDDLILSLKTQSEAEGQTFKQQLESYKNLRAAERQRLVDRKATQAELDAFDVETKKGEKERERIAAETKAQIISGALGAVADAVGRNTIAGKALAVAQATVDTYVGANKALATYPPPFGAIAAGTVILGGLLNVKKIVSTKLPKPPGSKVGGDSIAAPSISAPIVPQTPQAQLTQLDQTTINRMGSATNRTYVLESDVTNSQERITRINRAARLN